MAFLLTKSSIILCPHGGRVMHTPTGVSGKLGNGEIPMLLNDRYFVLGCSFAAGDYPSPCQQVNWAGGSKTRSINGVPVLTNASVGICVNAANAPQGPAVVSLCQTREAD